MEMAHYILSQSLFYVLHTRNNLLEANIYLIMYKISHEYKYVSKGGTKKKWTASLKPQI